MARATGVLAFDRDGMLKEHSESESETVEADELSLEYSLTAMRPARVGFFSKRWAKALRFWCPLEGGQSMWLSQAVVPSPMSPFQLSLPDP